MYDIAFLDELAANARPARVQQALEGWRLRASDGVTRRANSVLTNGPVPSCPDWFEAIEEFYRRQGLPSRYQISTASPPGLDSLLEERGYSFFSQTSVMVGDVRGVLSGNERVSGVELKIEEQVSENWLAVFMEAEGFPASQEGAYRFTFGSLGPRAAYVTALIEGQPAAVGMSVAERGWAGLFSIVTFPEFRRRGIGRDVVRGLAICAKGAGAEQLYLQVVASNEPAVRLYEQLGFEALYSYHYREKYFG
ncbi:MAG: GNAT family N-acetyltransferase [Chloroflexia bacterium]